MTAKRDETRSTYFVIGSLPEGGCLTSDPFPPFTSMGVYPTRKSWTVCEHLCAPEKALAYHQELNPILIVHGFILCQECNNRNILTGQDGFNTMLRFSSPQDDSFFQQFIMRQEVPDPHCAWAKLAPGSEDESERKRHVCAHLNTDQKLHTHYASRKMLFWKQDLLLCAPCFEELNNGERTAIEGSGMMLHGRSFSDRIIAPLCLINDEFFGLQG